MLDLWVHTFHLTHEWLVERGGRFLKLERVMDMSNIELLCE